MKSYTDHLRSINILSLCIARKALNKDKCHLIKHYKKVDLYNEDR